MISTILSSLSVAGDPQEDRLHGVDARAVPSRRPHHGAGVSSSAAKSLSNQAGSSGGILSFLNLFSGGALLQVAVFALGIMPYITASIILQLLTVVVPSLEKLSKEGEVGQARITQYTRYLTVGLAFAQSIGYVFLFRSLSSASQPIIPQFDLQHIFLIVMSMTAGTCSSCGWAS